MTIKYQAGGRIQGATTDTKPTDIEQYSRFEETDTQTIYYYNSGWYEDGVVALAGIGIFCGGGTSNIMDYI